MPFAGVLANPDLKATLKLKAETELGGGLLSDCEGRAMAARTKAAEQPA